jgi:hypothetical protein
MPISNAEDNYIRRIDARRGWLLRISYLIRILGGPRSRGGSLLA